MKGTVLNRFGTALRWALLLFAVILIIHGFGGSQFAPKNLSTLFVWVHYRGLLIFIVLLAGNLLCAGCPLVLARNLGRLWISGRLRWAPQF